jgi:hypothetical protein
MTLCMAIAAAYGVLQLAALGWFAGRSVRIGTLLLSIPAGLSACGVAALLLEYLSTRGFAAVSGTSLSDTVRTASYTIDPFIEELSKVAPLLVVGLHLRARWQWGLSDYVLLGAGLGAGFGLLEALLRFSDVGSGAITVPGGWVLPTGLSPTFIPDLGTTLGSWLPAPATSASLAFVTRPEVYLHLAWSAIGGLGAGVLLRGRGSRRLLGLVPIAFVSLEHCAVNYDLSLSGGKGIGGTLSAPLLSANRLLWLYPLLSLAGAGYFDLRDLTRGRARLPDMSRRAEQGDELIELGRFALLRLPWTALITLRFIRLRRSLLYAEARAPAVDVEPWHAAVRQVGEQITRANTIAAWQRLPPWPSLARAAVRGWLRLTWPMVAWVAILLPPLVYLGIGGFPATSQLQSGFTSSAARVVLPAILVAGLAWLLWRLRVVLRGLPETRRQPYGELTLRAGFQLMAGGGSLLVGGFSLWRLATGIALNQPVISNFHVIDALAGAITAVLFVLALAAIASMFPPAGLALAGGGALAASAGITVTPALLGQAAIVGGLSGILLANAAGSGATGGTQSTPQPSSAGVGPKPPAQWPTVSDSNLKNIVNDLHKGTANPNRLGDGTTMDAIRNEIATRQPTAGRWHITKGQEYASALKNWLRRNPNASASDRTVAQDLFQKLQDALAGKP